MIDTTSIALKLIISLLCFIYGTIFLCTKFKQSAGTFCGIGEFSIGLWTFLDIFQVFLKDAGNLIILQTAIYVCAEFAICSLFIFTNRIRNKEDYLYHKVNLKIFYIPLITIVLAIFFELFTNQHLFLIPPETISDIKYPAYSFPKRTYYFLHCLFSYGVISYAIFIIAEFLLQYLSKKKYLISIYLATFAFFSIVSVYKFVLENFLTSKKDIIPDYISSFSIFLMSSITFFMLFFHTRERNIRLTFEQFYYSCNFPIFIFSKKDFFLDTNSYGKQFLKSYNIMNSSDSKFSDIFPESAFLRLGLNNDQNSQNEFYLSNINDKHLYLCKKNKLSSFLKNDTGYYISIININFYSNEISNIKYNTSTDELTGCKKQKEFDRSYVKQTNSHDEPLIVISARVNNLEHLNEKIGLKKTDLYIMNFANILKSSINFTNIQAGIEKDIFRINGSLFVIIISIKQRELISDFFKYVKKECSMFSKNRVEPLTCSLGYSISSLKDINSQKALQKSFENLLLN